MFTNNINPVLLNIGPFSIRYYGLFIAIGFLGSYFMLKYLLEKDKTNPLTKDDVDDFYVYIILGVIIGARFFYSLIYNFQYYVSNPIQIFVIWRGGLSFHGGLIGCMLALLIYVYRYNLKHKKKINLYNITDVCTIPLALSIGLGRIGNFTNHELYGRVTDVPWAVKFRNIPGFRHPSQLYESIYGFFGIFPLQLWLWTKNLPLGFLTWSFFIFYGFFRFITEFFRQPDIQMGTGGFFFGWMSMGQILSVLTVIVGLVMIFIIYSKESKKYE